MHRGAGDDCVRFWQATVSIAAEMSSKALGREAVRIRMMFEQIRCLEHAQA